VYLWSKVSKSLLRSDQSLLRDRLITPMDSTFLCIFNYCGGHHRKGVAIYNAT
jgi:hypothetical protein